MNGEAQHQYPGSRSLRILIADDDRRMTRTLADIISLQGYEVVEAASGPEAMAKIQSTRFDCVLTDIKMPGLSSGGSGVDLARQLQVQHPDLPVVLMTAYAADELVRQGMDSGVVAILNKPLDLHQLLNFFASLAKTPTIAVVDDDANFCQTLGSLLELRGFCVHKITNPQQALGMINAETQVVLLDMKLNHHNGLDLLQELRRYYPGLPVLLVTGYRQEMAAVVQKAFDLKAYACFYKPLVIEDLLKTLSEIRMQQLRGLLECP